MAASPSISIAIIGSGGAGALTTGDSLLEAACAAGWHGLFTRTMGPQIRGGEAAALLRLAGQPVESLPDRYDLLIGIDWLNAARFGAEIKAGPKTLVISDPRGGDLPPMVAEAGPRVVEIPMKEMAKAIPDGRPNMIALGIAGRLLGFTVEQTFAPIAKRLVDKGPAAIEASLAGIKAGYNAAAGIDLGMQLAAPKPSTAPRWLLSGNEATALGAIRGGIRFAAAYPITPATEILEWLAPNLTKVGGTLLQAEDELAAINMIIGSSYGGTPSLTATSGPGLSLMIEALGLATSAEIPVVVVDVMRGGPSTGIPTKSEQGDLNIAIYGMHGDAPHLVLAPQSVGDCAFTAQWATYLAEALQSPTIILSDQFMGQSRAAIERPADIAFIGERTIADRYRRRRLQALRHDGQWRIADGDPRNARRSVYGRRPHPHRARDSDQRRRRSSGPARQAARQARSLQLRRPLGEHRRRRRSRRHHLGLAHRRRARSGGTCGRRRHRRPRDRAAPAGAGPAGTDDGRSCRRQTHPGRRAERTAASSTHYLRAHYDLPAPVRVFNRPGPLPITRR